MEKADSDWMRRGALCGIAEFQDRPPLAEFLYPAPQVRCKSGGCLNEALLTVALFFESVKESWFLRFLRLLLYKTRQINGYPPNRV